MRFMYFLVAMLIVMGLTMPHSYAAKINIVENGSFERGISPSEGYASSLSISSDYYYKHCQSAMVTQTSAGGGIKIPVKLEIGKVYLYSVWVRFDQFSYGSQSIKVGYMSSSGEKLLAASPELNAKDDWENITGEIQIMENDTDMYISVYVSSLSNALQTFYVDGLEIFDFNLLHAIDDSGPNIIDTIPKDKAYNIPTNQEMIVSFDKNIDFSTAIKDNITVNGTSSLIHNVIVDLENPTQLKITFNGLQPFTAYTVTFDNIKGITGIAMNTQSVTFVTKDVMQTVLAYDFENPDQVPSAYAGMTTLRQDTMAYTKDHSLIMQVWTGNQGWARAGWYRYDELNKKGKTFKVSFWAQIMAGTSRSDINVGLNGDNSVSMGKISGVEPGSGWQYCSLLYTMPEDFAGDLLLFFSFPGINGAYDKDSCVVYIDDLLVELIEDTKLLPISDPPSRSSNIEIDTDINLMFNYNINNNSVTADKIKINGGETPILGYEVINNTIHITLTQFLEYGKHYEIVLTDFKDQFGRRFSATTDFTVVPKYDFATVKFYKGYGTENQLEITKLQSGEITAVLDHIKNNTKSEKEIVFIASYYDNGKLTDVNISSEKIGAGEIISQPIILQMSTLDTGAGIYVLKAYVWEGLDRMQPILQTIPIQQ